MRPEQKYETQRIDHLGIVAGVCPFVGDQPFYGRRVAAMGVSPSPIRQGKFTAERLALFGISDLEKHIKK